MMNNSGRKKIWFTIEEFKSQLVTDIKRCTIEGGPGEKPEEGYEILIKHPNTSEVLERKQVPLKALKNKKSPWDELAVIGSQMKSTIHVETKIQTPVKKSPAPKKGKMNTSNIINH